MQLAIEYNAMKLATISQWNIRSQEPFYSERYFASSKQNPPQSNFIGFPPFAEANPELTWRDLQHLVVMTSNPKPLMHEKGWMRNAVGRQFSHKFGYGLLGQYSIATFPYCSFAASVHHNSDGVRRCV